MSDSKVQPQELSIQVLTVPKDTPLTLKSRRLCCGLIHARYARNRREQRRHRFKHPYPEIKKRYPPGILTFSINGIPPKLYSPLLDGDVVMFSVSQ